MENSIEDVVKNLNEAIYSEDIKSGLLAVSLNHKDNKDKTAFIIKGELELLVALLFKLMLSSKDNADLINITAQMYKVAQSSSLVEKFNKLDFNELLNVVINSIKLIKMVDEKTILTDSIINPFAQA